MPFKSMWNTGNCTQSKNVGIVFSERIWLQRTIYLMHALHTQHTHSHSHRLQSHESVNNERQSGACFANSKESMLINENIKRGKYLAINSKCFWSNKNILYYKFENKDILSILNNKKQESHIRRWLLVSEQLLNFFGNSPS